MGYRGPNGIYEDFTKRARTLISVVQRSDSEDEPVTRGMPYNFAVLNSPVTGHIGKMIINPKLVKPILMKPMVLDQGHVILPQCKILDIEEH